MTAKTGQDASIYAGDVVSLRFPIEDENGAAAALTAPVGYWKTSTGLSDAERATPVISKFSPSNGVRLVEETISSVDWWVAYVDLDEDDTADSPGVYQHQLRIVDGATELVVAVGKIVVKPLIGV
jgi:hypothetical protein